MALDGIGLTERFRDSVELIFSQLGLAMPKSIAPTQVTDDLPNSDTRFVPVPKVVMTPRLSRALEALTRYDRIIYDVAKREFQRRLSARSPKGALDAKLTVDAPMAGVTGQGAKRYRPITQNFCSLGRTRHGGSGERRRALAMAET